MAAPVPGQSDSTASVVSRGGGPVSLPALGTSPLPESTAFSLKSFLLDEEIKLQQQRLQHMLQLRQQQLDQHNRALLEQQLHQKELLLEQYLLEHQSSRSALAPASPTHVDEFLSPLQHPRQMLPVAMPHGAPSPLSCLPLLQQQAMGEFGAAPLSLGVSPSSLAETSYCEREAAQLGREPASPAQGQLGTSQTGTDFACGPLRPVSPGLTVNAPLLGSSSPGGGCRVPSAEKSPPTESAPAGQIAPGASLQPLGGTASPAGPPHDMSHQRDYTSKASVDEAENSSRRRTLSVAKLRAVSSARSCRSASGRATPASTLHCPAASQAAGAAEQKKEGEKATPVNKSPTRLDLSMAVYQRMKTVDVQRGTESSVLEEVEDLLLRGAGSPYTRKGETGSLSHACSDPSASGAGGRSAQTEFFDDGALPEKALSVYPEGTGFGELRSEASKLQILAEKLQAQEEEKRTMQEESFQVEQLLKRQYYQDMQKKNAENETLKKQLDCLREEVNALNRHLSATLQDKTHLEDALSLAQDALTHAVDSMVFSPRSPPLPHSSAPALGVMPLPQITAQAERNSAGRDDGGRSPAGAEAEETASRAAMSPDSVFSLERVRLQAEAAAGGVSEDSRSVEARDGHPSKAKGLYGPDSAAEEGARDRFADNGWTQRGDGLCARLETLMDRLGEAVGNLDTSKLDSSDEEAVKASLRDTCETWSAGMRSSLLEENEAPGPGSAGQHPLSGSTPVTSPPGAQGERPGFLSAAVGEPCAAAGGERGDAITEKQLHQLRNEVTILRQKLQVFTGDVAAVQKRHRTSREHIGGPGAGSVKEVDKKMSAADRPLLQKLDELQKLNEHLLLDNTMLHQLCNSQLSPVFMSSVANTKLASPGSPASSSGGPMRPWITPLLSASQICTPLLHPSVVLHSPLPAATSPQHCYPLSVSPAGAEMDAGKRGIAAHPVSSGLRERITSSTVLPAPTTSSNVSSRSAFSVRPLAPSKSFASASSQSLFAVPSAEKQRPQGSGALPHPALRRGSQERVTATKSGGALEGAKKAPGSGEPLQRERKGSLVLAQGLKAHELRVHAGKASRESQSSTDQRESETVSKPAEGHGDDRGAARQPKATGGGAAARRQMAPSHSQPVLVSRGRETRGIRKGFPAVPRKQGSDLTRGPEREMSGASLAGLPYLPGDSEEGQRFPAAGGKRGDLAAGGGRHQTGKHAQKTALPRRIVQPSVSAAELPPLRQAAASHVVPRVGRGGDFGYAVLSPCASLPPRVVSSGARSLTPSGMLSRGASAASPAGVKSVPPNSPDLRARAALAAVTAVGGPPISQVSPGRAAGAAHLAVVGRGYAGLGAVHSTTGAVSPKVFQRTAKRGDETSRSRRSQGSAQASFLWIDGSRSVPLVGRESVGCVSRASSEAEDGARSRFDRAWQADVASTARGSSVEAACVGLHPYPQFPRRSLSTQRVFASAVSPRGVATLLAGEALSPSCAAVPSAYYPVAGGGTPYYYYASDAAGPQVVQSGATCVQVSTAVPNSVMNLHSVGYSNPVISTPMSASPLENGHWSGAPGGGGVLGAPAMAFVNKAHAGSGSRRSAAESEGDLSRSSLSGSDTVGAQSQGQARSYSPAAAGVRGSGKREGRRLVRGAGSRELFRDGSGLFARAPATLTPSVRSKSVPRVGSASTQSSLLKSSRSTSWTAEAAPEGAVGEPDAGSSHAASTASKRRGVSPASRVFRPLAAITSFFQQQFPGLSRAADAVGSSPSGARDDQTAIRGRSLTSPVRGKVSLSCGVTGMWQPESKMMPAAGSDDSAPPVRAGRAASMTAVAQAQPADKDVGTRLSPLQVPPAQDASFGQARSIRCEPGFLWSANGEKSAFRRRDLGISSTAASRTSGNSVRQQKPSLCGMTVLCDVPFLQHSSAHLLCGEAASQGSLISTPKSEFDVADRRMCAPGGRLPERVVSMSALHQMHVR
ncbi:hypothetical protein BESB_011400 [Besnoitia besnoiti]|uniref:Uncharacterized protein n=1 Tax=Besnoitia besnoiti TaxID=94643 RepID=A0A2A9MJS9_BESBE|nr:hypothetical protein BESB_011400 [Besnoitia besnoiti]PFH38798.1 hypothetical protein BESB_011400 [Besnoitia besnoiti]